MEQERTTVGEPPLLVYRMPALNNTLSQGLRKFFMNLGTVKVPRLGERTLSVIESSCHLLA